jgi:hypothetical protein
MHFTKQISHSKLHLKSANKIPVYLCVILFNQSFDITLINMHSITHMKFVAQHTHSICLGIHQIFFQNQKDSAAKGLGNNALRYDHLVLKSQLILYMYNLNLVSVIGDVTTKLWMQSSQQSHQHHRPYLCM